MAEKQVTTMVIKVDLGCEKCAKKIKKVLCKIPLLKRSSKGGETIKGIEIKLHVKPAPQPVPQPSPKPAPQPVPQLPAKPPPQLVPQPAPPPIAPVRVSLPRTCCHECYEGVHGGPCFYGYGTPAPPPCYGPYGRPVYDSWGGGSCDCERSGYYVCRCEYVYDDNRSSCIIM